MIGKAVLSLLDFSEEYIFSFPSAYGRSILTVPWFEMGGQVTILCPKSGYNTTIDFLTKVNSYLNLFSFINFMVLLSLKHCITVVFLVEPRFLLKDRHYFRDNFCDNE